MKSQAEIENLLDVLIKNQGGLQCVKYDVLITIIDLLSWILDQDETFQDVVDAIFTEVDIEKAADDLI